jgi:hypothetical protein
VIRRCPAPLTALVTALALGLGLQPTLTRADQVGTVDYSLTFPDGLAAPSGPSPTSGSSSIAAPQVVLLVDPAGGVVAPSSSSTQGPLTVLAGSSGFDTSGVYDYLATSTDSNGQPLQALGLSFYGSGIAAGGVLNFSLEVTNVNSPPTLEWVNNGSQTMSPFTPNPVYGTTAATSGSSTSDVNITPEPLSLLLWSALAGAGLVRTRCIRRNRRVSSEG